MASREKKKGKCDACDKDPRILLQIDSGQWLCQTCRRQFKQATKSKECEFDIENIDRTSDDLKANRECLPATEKQIAYARRLGFDVDESSTRGQVSEFLDVHDSVKCYVYDVWQAITGNRPKDCDISRNHLDRVICRVITELKIGKIIDEIEMQRYDAMCEASDYHESRGEEVNFKDLKPPLERDRIFKSVASLLKKQFPEIYTTTLVWRSGIKQMFARFLGL